MKTQLNTQTFNLEKTLTYSGLRIITEVQKFNKMVIRKWPCISEGEASRAKTLWLPGRAINSQC